MHGVLRRTEQFGLSLISNLNSAMAKDTVAGQHRLNRLKLKMIQQSLASEVDQFVNRGVHRDDGTQIAVRTDQTTGATRLARSDQHERQNRAP